MDWKKALKHIVSPLSGITDTAWYQERSQGYKNKQGVDDLMSSIPEGEDFNPYDYIESNNYTNNARGRQAYQEDLAKLLYLAQINQEDRMNEYNSPEQQVERMRLAGINPDLNGVSNEPASNVAGYQGNPMEGTNTAAQEFTNAVGVISSVTSMITGIATGVTGIQSAFISNFANSVSASSSLFDLFDKTSLSDTDSPVSYFADMLPALPNKIKSRIMKARSSWISSTYGRTSVNDHLSDYLVSQGRFNRESLDSRNSSDIDIYTDAWLPYIDALQDLAVSQLKGDKAKSDYDASYYSSDLAENKADMEKGTADIFKQLKQPIIDVMKNFDKIENEEFRNTAKAALASLILKFLPL